MPAHPDRPERDVDGGSGPDERPAAPAGLEDRPAPPSGSGRVAVLAFGLGLLAVLAIWAAAAGVGPARFDEPALTESLETRTPGLTELAIVVTTIGSTVGSALLAVAVGAWCWARGRRADAVLAIGAMAGASLVFRGLKMVLDRARPPVVDRAVTVTNESLPSGHATMSFVVVGTIVVLTWAGRSAAARVAIVAAAALWVGAVGATRVYLGVHWLSDVLAGWAVGAAWLTLCVLVWRRWRPAAARTHR